MRPFSSESQSPTTPSLFWGGGGGGQRITKFWTDILPGKPLTQHVFDSFTLALPSAIRGRCFSQLESYLFPERPLVD